MKMVQCDAKSVERNKSISTWLIILFIIVAILGVLMIFLGMYVLGMDVLSLWWVFVILIGFLVVVLVFVLLVRACEEPSQQKTKTGKVSGGKTPPSEAESEL